MCSAVLFPCSVIPVYSVVPMFYFSYALYVLCSIIPVFCNSCAFPMLYISDALYFLCYVISVYSSSMLTVFIIPSNDVDVATLHNVIYCKWSLIDVHGIFYLVN